MSGRLRTTIVAAALGLLLLAAASAYAIKGQVGNTVVSSTATMLPRELPAKGGAPITLTSVTRVRNKDGSPPQKLSKIDFLIDKHAYVDAKGVPVCTTAKLEGTTTSGARKRCAGSLVGEGKFDALVNLPGQAQRKVSLPISFFNGPKVGGQPSLLGHTHEAVPVPKTLLVPVTVEKVSKGRYGFRLEVGVPQIADGYGTTILAEATIGKTRTQGGRKVGYLNAYCSGGRLQVKGKLYFENGDLFPALLTSPCHVPG
ncbi:MAG TPA: hypothetical protein VG458_09685 [Solirubrobacterales bacterium]|nr:hypothetical protein [Solirubrobacterales bacterium]